MHYTAGRILVKVMSGEVVVDREVEAFLAGESGLAFHPTLVEDPAEGDPETLGPLYTITHVPTGCALGSLPMRGEGFAREALEKIAQIQERYPHSVRWQDERPFASGEIARLAGQIIHWILVDVWSRSTLAARRQGALPVPPAPHGSTVGASCGRLRPLPHRKTGATHSLSIFPPVLSPGTSARHGPRLPSPASDPRLSPDLPMVLERNTVS